MDRRPIQQLAPAVVSKIAAGEVIERPSSIVKELLENALDAGAGAITIDVVEGGRDLVRVVDDGAGIPRAELPLAVANHATNKIADADELFRVRTLGFRGEALASIAGVSRLSLRSRPLDQPVGAALEVEHGMIGSVVECGCPPGTQVEVRDLFGSVPVRRKFLKSKQTELGHIQDAVTRVALAHPQVALRLVHNDRVVAERPAHLDWPATIRQLFGPDAFPRLLPIDAHADELRIHGFVSEPGFDRPNAKSQYLFVNGRFVRDRSLGHAITEAYRGLLMTGRYPIAVLFFEVPPDQVDVNVHPTKIEIRFRDPHQVYSLLLASLRNRFLSSNLTTRLRPPREGAVPPAARADAPEAHPASGDEPPDPAPALLSRSERREAIRESFSLQSRSSESLQPSLWGTRQPPAPAVPPEKSGGPQPRPAPIPLPAAPTLASEPKAPAPADRAPARAPARTLQLHNTYLVVETDDGMLLIDQHALHERVLYESLLAKVSVGQVEAQELLVPEPVDLPGGQAGLVLEQREVLERLGIRVEEFGRQCVLVGSLPRLVGRAGAARLIEAIAAKLEETGRPPAIAELLDDLLRLVACKAAVKAGDHLTPEEIDALVRQRNLVVQSHHCPHGRPAVLRFTLGELERQFKRV